VTAEKEPLTICSVSYKSRLILQVNYKLVHRLNNPALLDKWVVIDNTPQGKEEPFESQYTSFQVLPGPPFPKEQKGHASYHHAAGLNEALKAVRTRFVLIQDPDFFITRMRWIEEIVGHMKERCLAFFGAPWHPRWYRKWRYFPCAHCLFIDLERVERERLDFTPDIAHQSWPHLSLFIAEHEWMCARGQRFEAWRRILRHPRITLAEDGRDRTIIGSSRDTGISIYEAYCHAPGIRYEVFQPVYRPDEDRLVPLPGVRLDGKSALRSLLERIRPDWLSFVPKRRGYFTKTGFAGFGLPDLRARGWEEFVWKKRPLGFHVRSSLQDKKPSSPAEIQAILETLVSHEKAQAEETK
jgi:hypothetical protein